MFKKIMWSLLIGFSLLFIGITVFLFLNKDFIKNQTINALNAQLDAKVDVSGPIDLTFLSSFPQINLSFQDVFVEDKLRINDTLAYVGSLELSLNPWSIIQKDYTINGISLSNGMVNIYTDINGLSNYNILKPKEDTNTESTLLQLKSIYLKNMNLKYLDEQNDTYVDLYTGNSKISGTFFKQDFTLKINTELSNRELVINETKLLVNKKVQGDLTLDYQGTDGCIIFKNNTINIEGNTFNINGNICTKTNTLSLIAEANGNDLQKVLGLVPNDWLDASMIKGNGSYHVKAAIKGDLNKPTADVDFNIKDGKMYLEEEDLQLDKVAISGNYSNVKQTNGALFIHSFNCNSLQSTLSGKLDIKDLGKIEINTQLNGSLSKELIQRYMPESFDIQQGSIDINTLSLIIKQQDNLWKLKEIEGELALTNLQGFIQTLDLPFSCTGNLIGKENYLSALGLVLNIGENNLNFDGELKNLLELVLNPNQENNLELGLIGSLKSSRFNVNDFIQDRENTASNNEIKDITIPPINGKLNLVIDKFIYQKLEMTNVKIDARANNTAYTFKIKNAETLGGRIDGELLTNVVNNDFEVNLSTNIYGVDMQKMFEAFDDFGQTSMGSNNIKGKLTSQLSLSSTWKNFTDFDASSFIMSSHMSLKDGELMNFAPLLGLSGKLDIEQLEHLYFTDLTADIFIKDEIISMPMTEIKSNLLSLKVGGKHHFDNRINYSLVLNLKNILAAKFKKKQTTKENYVNDITGGINLYISMTGTVDDPIISYDRDSVKDKIKADFKDEKQEFKNLFKKDEKSEFEKNEIKFEELKEEDKYLDWEEE